VSLVSVPLSISLAIAAGATPGNKNQHSSNKSTQNTSILVMGIVTAFWAGLVSALLGGSHYNIVGPTGALSGNEIHL
jgi:SulP family sulfate permease